MIVVVSPYLSTGFRGSSSGGWGRVLVICGKYRRNMNFLKTGLLCFLISQNP
jgi:hypothetical protein